MVVGRPEPFTDALVAHVERLECGDPALAGVTVGPVISEPARDRVLDATGRDGGRVVTGGGRVDGPGWFVRPTVVTGLDGDAHLNRHEVFGPICTLNTAPDGETAVRMANASDYGLVTALYTRDLDAAMSYVAGCRSGMVKVNAPTTGVDFHLPFGGEKGSGYGGREQGKAAVHFYTSSHTVQVSPHG